jgi:long-chain fatty acid transport protein
LPRDWHAAGEIELFAEWQRTTRHRIWAVAGFHGGAVPDHTMDPSSPDGRRIIVAVGNALQLSERLAVVIDAEVHTLVPRTVRASDYDLGNGEYRMTIASLGLFADVGF